MSASHAIEVAEAFAAYRTDIMRQQVGNEHRIGDMALRRVLGLLTPLTIYQGRMHGDLIIWIPIGSGKTIDWVAIDDVPVPAWIEAQMRPNSMTMWSPQHQTWVGKVEILEQWRNNQHWPQEAVQRIISDVLEQVVDNLVRQWLREESDQFAAIGLADWTLAPYPENPAPSPQISAVGGIDLRTGHHQGTLPVEYVFQRAQSWRLIKDVPETVRNVFQRGAELWVWGYMEWEFFTASEHYAVMAVESSLKALYMDQLVYPARISIVDTESRNVVAEQDFAQRGDHQKLYNACRDLLSTVGRYEPGRQVLVNGDSFPRTKGKLRDWALSKDFLSPLERREIDYLFWLRDIMSHPEGVGLDWITWVEDRFGMASRLINRMWLRARNPEQAMWQHMFVRRPQWSQATKHTMVKHWT